MLRFISLALLTAYTVDVVLAGSQSGTKTKPRICDGYMWGVTIKDLGNVGTNTTVYNRWFIYLL